MFVIGQISNLKFPKIFPSEGQYSWVCFTHKLDRPPNALNPARHYHPCQGERRHRSNHRAIRSPQAGGRALPGPLPVPSRPEPEPERDAANGHLQMLRLRRRRGRAQVRAGVREAGLPRRLEVGGLPRRRGHPRAYRRLQGRRRPRQGRAWRWPPTSWPAACTRKSSRPVPRPRPISRTAASRRKPASISSSASLPKTPTSCSSAPPPRTSPARP